ncbi:MAG: DNA internalization-related competence protein ComEC/Rec2 [Anaerocolumna sp.]
MNIKRPLIWLLASYLAGLAFYSVKFSLVVLIGGTSLIPVLLWLLLPIAKRKTKITNYYFLLCLPMLFILGYTLINHQLSPNSLDSVFESEINGKVTGQLESVQDKGDYLTLTLKNNTIILKKSKKYFSSKFTIYTSSKVQYRIGNILSVSGKIQKFQKASNPGQFDEYQYNKMLGIDYKMKADSIEISNTAYSVFRQLLYEIKRRFMEVYQKILPPKNAGILSAMILGDMSLLDPELKELYQQSGISHILAISGLHVSLLGLTLYQFLRHIRLPAFLTAGISIFIIFSYGVLTNFSVSTNRAVVMLVIFMAAGLIGRTYDLLSASAFSALVILIQSPLQIKNAGFLLSFGAIMGIALMNPVISLFFPVKNKLWEGLKSSLSIQIMTLPIILYFFYEFPTYSVMINMIILPTSSIIILLAVLAGILGCIYLPFGIFAIGAVHYLLNFYEWVCRMGAKLPWKTFLIGRPSIMVIIAYYFVIIIILSFYLKIKRKACLILLSFLVIIFIKSKNISFNVTFLDVGQGDGIFMMSPNGTTYLIDGGSTDISKVGRYRLEPYLKVNGIRFLDYAIVSHMDSDHISGLKELMQAMEESEPNHKTEWYKGNIIIRNLILPDILQKDEAYMDLVSLALSKGIKILYIQKGDTIEDGEVNFTCLHPDPDYNFTSRNAYSTVLSVSYKDFDLLLTGDLETDGEDMVLQELKAQKDNTDIISDQHTKPAIDYDVLKVAHHGSKYSTYEQFLDVIKPEYSIISCGKDNSYGHPDPELIKRLKDIKSDIKITYGSGAISIKTDGEYMKVSEYKRK